MCSRVKTAVACTTSLSAVFVFISFVADALYKRYRQGWLQEVITDLDTLIVRVREAKKRGEATSIGFLVSTK